MNQPRRLTVYIDAFNWYHAIFKHRPAWKWLNIQAFFESLRPDDDLRQVKFFTALIHPKNADNPARHRMERYLRALGSLSKVVVVHGKYQEREVVCGANCRQRYRVPEEKKTDVNMAVHLIDDAIKNATDRMALVSGDSDLEPAVLWVAKNYPNIKITVYIPSLPEEQPYRRLDCYRSLNIPCAFLPLARLMDHQLPPRMLLKNGSCVERPESWK